ncbi:GAF domain-containing protein [Neoroseomonas rubea]|uniref:GAF domain-containing protein n=1 Tax=Neoroseomonas rubea TaxID=2748666 RepID=UPI0018DF508E|nr:GAF domain-containing protein [Roseomonas rubea]
MATRATIGHRLFTVMRHDPIAGRNRRIFTSDPVAYPVSGHKPVDWAHPWAQRVLRHGEPWIGQTSADIAWAYPDHERIAAMGLGSAMNLPVRWNGVVLGTVNLLDAEGHFAEESAIRGMVFAALAVPALLAIDEA